jgi:5'-3' exonuclease
MKPSHTMQELVILDGTAMLFRAYYSMRYQAPDGMEVGAVMGMTERTLRMMRRLQPSHVAIVFDAGKKTFRNEIDPRYKANRDGVKIRRQEINKMLGRYDLMSEQAAAKVVTRWHENVAYKDAIRELGL